MKNLPTLIGLGEENQKIKTLKKSSLVIALSTLYLYRESLSSSIFVATERLDEPQLFGGLEKHYRLLGVLWK